MLREHVAQHHCTHVYFSCKVAIKYVYTVLLVVKLLQIKISLVSLGWLAKPKAIVVIHVPKFQPLPNHLRKTPSKSAKYRQQLH